MHFISQNLFCCQHEFLRIQMPLLLSFINLICNMTYSRSCDQWKITQRIERY